MSLGFKIYSYFNGNLVHQDSLGNKFYQDKLNSNKRWIIYADNLGPELFLLIIIIGYTIHLIKLDKNIHELEMRLLTISRGVLKNIFPLINQITLKVIMLAAQIKIELD